jgi:preprotein translocase subunit SecG
MYTFLLVVQGLIAAALIGVILMQKSEGGGLGVGGSPAGFLSARGASDFLTRATAVLAALFVALCIGLAVIASVNNASGGIDVEAAKAASRSAVPLPAETPAPGAPGVAAGAAPGAASGDPLAAAAAGAVQPAEQPNAVPVEQ